MLGSIPLLEKTKEGAKGRRGGEGKWGGREGREGGEGGEKKERRDGRGEERRGFHFLLFALGKARRHLSVQQETRSLVRHWTRQHFDPVLPSL